MQVQSLPRASRDAAARMLARSFEDDPMFRFLLSNGRTRPAWLELVMVTALDECLAHGEVLVADLDGLAGAIGIIPPALHSAPAFTRISSLVWLFLSTLPPPPPLAFLLNGPRVLNLIGAKHPRDPHLYVQVLGADPERQGRGVGAALVERALERAARDGVYAYLETTNAKNLVFYGRFGFRVIEGISPSPGGGPPIWLLRT